MVHPLRKNFLAAISLLALALIGEAACGGVDCRGTLLQVLQKLPTETRNDVVFELFYPLITSGEGYLASGEDGDVFVHEDNVVSQTARWMFRDECRFSGGASRQSNRDFYIKVTLSAVGGASGCEVSPLEEESPIFQQMLGQASSVLAFYRQKQTITDPEVAFLQEQQTHWKPGQIFFFQALSQRKGERLSALGLIDRTSHPGIFSGPYRQIPIQPGEPVFELTRTMNAIPELVGPSLITPWISTVIVHRLGNIGTFAAQERLWAVTPQRQRDLFSRFFHMEADPVPASPLVSTPLFRVSQSAANFVEHFPPTPGLGQFLYLPIKFANTD
jgi:hypothetical protein